MNRTDRLLAIVLELQAKGRQRAEDLAATFETSKRTIYRDIQALSEAGVPIVAVTGQGYSLSEGYFLPPLTFSSEEATMLLLGSDFLAQTFDPQYVAAAQSASRKIVAVLPDRLRPEVKKLQDSIRFISPNSLVDPSEPQNLRQLRRAVIEQKTVYFRYHTRHTDDGASAQNSRSADPYALVHLAEAWYMIGYCHLRHDIRHFRLERMEDITLSGHTFTRPPSFRIGPHEGDDQRKVVIKALFDHEVARWVQESHLFYIVEQVKTAGGLLVTLKVRRESDLLQWLLGWGAHVRVLEPESLRKRLMAEATAIIQNHRGLPDEFALGNGAASANCSV